MASDQIVFQEGDDPADPDFVARLNRLKNAVVRAAKRAFGVGFEASGGALGKASGPPFWAYLSGATSPYDWHEAVDTPGGWQAAPGLRTGTGDAVEVNGLAGLGGQLVLLVPRGAKNYFLYHRLGGPQDPCPDGTNRLCGSAWSLTEYCDAVNSTAGLDCDGTAGDRPGAISGAAVTIIRTYTDKVTGQIVYEPYASGVTDADGEWCKLVPPTLADPTLAPTVDPVGGGASGGTLVPGQYTVQYSWITHYGETLPSPPSTPFQVGIADAGTIPVLGVPVVNQQPLTTGGGLQFGAYFGRVVYRDDAGLHNAPQTVPVQIRAGVVNPTAAPASSALAGPGSSLGAGDWQACYTFANGPGETLLSPACPVFTQAPGLVWTLSFPVLPPAAAGINVYLSPDYGATWYWYAKGLTGTSLALMAPVNPANTGVPSSNSTAGNIPRITAASLSLRPFATAIDLYLGVGAAGPFRYYKSYSGSLLDLDVAFSPTAALMPGVNNSAKNIPQVSFTPGGDYSRLYAVRAGAQGCQYLTATVSPKNYSGTLSQGCPSTQNTTGQGTFLIKVKPDDCAPQSSSVLVVAGGCRTYAVSFGFCCASHEVTTNADKLDCGNYDACVQEFNDSKGTIENNEWWSRCAQGEPCGPNQGYTNYVQCGNLFGSIHHPQPTRCHLTKPDYWDRTICIVAPCDVPGIKQEVTADVYSKADYVRATGCCGPACVGDPNSGYTYDRPRDVIKRTLLVWFRGNKGLTGSDQEVGPFTVTLNEARSVGAYWIWDVCLPGQGGYGLCYAPIRYACLFPDPDPYRPCTTLGVLGGEYSDGVLYKSTRVTVVQGKGMDSDDLNNTPCTGSVVWENFWNPGCPQDDPAPYCGWDVFYGYDSQGNPMFRPVYASGQENIAPDCVACPCGIVPIGHPEAPARPSGSILNYVGTKSQSVPITGDSKTTGLCSGKPYSGELRSSSNIFYAYRDCNGVTIIVWSARIEEA